MEENQAAKVYAELPRGSEAPTTLGIYNPIGLCRQETMAGQSLPLLWKLKAAYGG